MKLLKVLSLSFILFFISANTIFAQSGKVDLTDEQKKELENNLKEYFTTLNLAEEQKPEFESITMKYMEKMKAVKDSGGSRLTKYRKITSIRDDKNAEMKKLLSKDQYKVYLDKQEEMQKKMKEKRRR